MLNIKVLGPGCINCYTLEQRVGLALDQIDAEATIQHVKDHDQFRKYGLMFTPGLVVNERLVSAGRIPPVPEIVTFLTTAMMESEKPA